MRIKKASVVILVAFLFVGIFPDKAFACSCIAPGPPEEALAEASAVFSGRVTDLSEEGVNNPLMGQGLRVDLDVTEAWKGVSQNTVTVLTATNSAACGYPFQKDKEYLVYAYRSAESTELQVSLCSRTAELSNAQEDLQALGEASVATSSPVNEPNDAGDTEEASTSANTSTEDVGGIMKNSLGDTFGNIASGVFDKVWYVALGFLALLALGFFAFRHLLNKQEKSAEKENL